MTGTLLWTNHYKTKNHQLHHLETKTHLEDVLRITCIMFLNVYVLRADAVVCEYFISGEVMLLCFYSYF